MVRLQLLGIIFCIGFSLKGSEQRNDLELLLFSADRSANVGHLGIFYDPTYPIKNIEQGCRNLFDFRKNYSADIDYIVDTSVNKIS